MSRELKRQRAEAEAARHAALVRLGIARREKLASEDYDVYCDGLQAFDPDVVRVVERMRALAAKRRVRPVFSRSSVPAMMRSDSGMSL